MIDKVYSHLNSKDKAKKVSNAFKSLNNGIFNMGKVETNSLNEVKPTNDATNNITSILCWTLNFLHLKSIKPVTCLNVWDM